MTKEKYEASFMMNLLYGLIFLMENNRMGNM